MISEAEFLFVMMTVAWGVSIYICGDLLQKGEVDSSHGANYVCFAVMEIINSLSTGIELVLVVPMKDL